MTETVANIFPVNNSKAMEKIIRDEKLHQKKEEERLKKQDDKPLGKILTK